MNHTPTPTAAEVETLDKALREMARLSNDKQWVARHLLTHYEPRKGEPTPRVETTIMPPKVTIELGPVTLRALYEVLYEIGLLSDNQRMALRAELAKTEPKP